VSLQNVEIVRQAIDAFNRRDIDAVFRDIGPEIVLDWSRSRGVEAGIYYGHEAGREFWSNFLEIFDPFIVSPDEFIECREHVIVPARTRMWGRDGIKVEAHATAVVTLRDGLIVKWCMYQETADALKAVGRQE
jgi:ketosteroid isomerase-like protein